MTEALILSALLLGLAGMPHCAAMCGASCMALTSSPLPGASRSAMVVFHLARAASYGLLGALLAWVAGAMPALVSAAPMLRPLWTLVHLAMFMLGAWLLATGRLPLWLGRFGLRPAQAAPAVALEGGAQPIQIVRKPPLRRAFTAGLLWGGWPCGLLQTALLTASLASTPWGGGVAMVVFALASSPALWIWPWLLRKLGQRPLSADGELGRWAVRLAGVGLLAGSGFALWHGLWGENGLFC